MIPKIVMSSPRQFTAKRRQLLLLTFEIFDKLRWSHGIYQRFILVNIYALFTTMILDMW